MSDLVTGADGLRRCRWGASTPEYERYHDAEWGRPVVDDVRLYEKLCLEGFQSGLSWITILRKREAFRRVFKDFDPKKVARFGDKDVERMLGDAGIVRHRGKIEATIANAQGDARGASRAGSLAAPVRSFERSAERHQRRSPTWLRRRPSRPRLSKEPRRGFKFVGPTTC
jgi:DNA-3-methyladenine glycosylase I